MKELDPQSGAADADALAEAIALPRADDVVAATRPENVGLFYVEEEYAELAREQRESYAALGIEVARPSKVTAARLKLVADTDASLVKGQVRLVDNARARHMQVVEALSPFVRRPAKAEIPHYATKAGLFIGEGLGLFGALLWLGEVEWVAAVMGVSVASATLTAGLSGAEVKDLRNRALRRREPEQLTEEQRAFPHLFSGPDPGWSYVRAILFVSVSVALTLAVTIGTLRGVVDDPIVGVVFGAIGIAVAGASFLDSYSFADEMADAISRTRRSVAFEEKLLGIRARSTAWQQQAASQAEAAALGREHEQRGKAADTHMTALLARILRGNVGVVGHGRASEPTAIGKTTRRSGGAK